MLDPMVASKLLTEAIIKRAKLIDATINVVTYVKESGVIKENEFNEPYVTNIVVYNQITTRDGVDIIKLNGVYYGHVGDIKYGNYDIDDIYLIGDENQLVVEFNLSSIDEIDLTPKLKGQPNVSLDPESTYPSDFANGYNTYGLDGIVLGGLNSGGDTSQIEAILSGGKQVDVTEFAQAFSDYWATVCIDPGVPSHGGMSVISSINNADTLVSLFVDAITASITNVESKPYFYNFIKNIEDIAVKQIQWTITELMPGSPPYPAVFIETIS
jgi:hypothetical protein